LEESLERCRAFAKTSSASDVAGVLNPAIERLRAYTEKLDTTPADHAQRLQLLKRAALMV
jgi:hypothetical protein